MADEEKQDQNLENEDEKKDDVQPAAEPQKPDNEHMIPKSRLDEEIQKRKDLEKRLSAIEKANKEAETKRLKEQDDYKALYEKAEAELSETKPKAERSESLEAVLKETLETEIVNIPQDRLGLIPEELSVEAKLRYISKNRALLMKVQPVDQGAGNRGGGEPIGVELTPEQKEMAQKMGVKPEDYAKQLKK